MSNKVRQRKHYRPGVIVQTKAGNTGYIYNSEEPFEGHYRVYFLDSKGLASLKALYFKSEGLTVLGLIKRT